MEQYVGLMGVEGSLDFGEFGVGPKEYLSAGQRYKTYLQKWTQVAPL